MKGKAQDGLAVYIDDDGGFEEWINAHPEGYVVNVSKDMRTMYKLHKAKCHTLHHLRSDYKGFTQLNAKVCTTDRDAIIRWIREKYGTDPDLCGFCM